MPPPIIRIFLDSLGMGPAFSASPPRKGHPEACFREECELVDSGSASCHEKACRAPFQRDYINTTRPTVEISPLRSKLQNAWVSWGVVGHSEVSPRLGGSLLPGGLVLANARVAIQFKLTHYPGFGTVLIWAVTLACSRHWSPDASGRHGQTSALSRPILDKAP
jgi:hypothetical protein